MKVIRHRDEDFAEQIQSLTVRSSLFDPVIEERTRSICEAVRQRGDEAVLELTRKFDGAQLTADDLVVTKAELQKATSAADTQLREALKAASANISTFSQLARRHDWDTRNQEGGRVGEKFDPFQRVGLYIPGGTAPLVSTALMTILLAKVAGCPEIVVCTPCDAEGKVNDALLFAAKQAGANEIYRIGGAQAIAAMAYGTQTIRPVQKVFGPGNAYVVMAKRLLFGYVSVDLLPGPSELLILADKTANPAFCAADLLAQAEHGSGHERTWLITDSSALLKSVQKEMDRQLSSLNRADRIRQALDANGYLIQVKSLDQGVELANALAPEHCEIMTKNPRSLSREVKTAGAIFLGDWSPTVLGDYVAGPSHTLPTGGAGLSFAGLTVDQFQRRTSIVEYNRTSLKKSVPLVEVIAGHEGLTAHARSASIRLESQD